MKNSSVTLWDQFDNCIHYFTCRYSSASFDFVSDFNAHSGIVFHFVSLGTLTEKTTCFNHSYRSSKNNKINLFRKLIAASIDS